MAPSALARRSVAIFWGEDACFFGAEVRGVRGPRHDLVYYDGTREEVLVAAERMRVQLRPGETLAAAAPAELRCAAEALGGQPPSLAKKQCLRDA